MKTVRSMFFCLAGLVILASVSVPSAPAAVSASFTPLTLQNGWTNAPFSTRNAAVATINGIVHFQGAIAGGTDPVVFTLPASFRPSTDTYVPVDLCNATNGRLYIQPSGVTEVEAEGGTFSNAQCFTSLEGVSFVNASGSTLLTLRHGWTNAPFSTRNARVRVVNGIVHFQGAIAGGTSDVAFRLPTAFRPSTNVFVPADLCDATKGRLFIQPSGVTRVEAEGSFSNAQCFTSLEGVSFVNTSGSTALTLQNGWTNAPFSTRNARVRVANGIVRLQGAIAGGTSSVVFRLPTGFRPSTATYVPVDLCNATNGRLYIQPSGVTEVETEGSFSDAQCFTSLEGAWFAQ